MIRYHLPFIPPPVHQFNHFNPSKSPPAVNDSISPQLLRSLLGYHEPPFVIGGSTGLVGPVGLFVLSVSGNGYSSGSSSSLLIISPDPLSQEQNETYGNFHAT